MRFAMYALPEIQEREFIDAAVVRDWAENLSRRLGGA
jgi:hypothetical protein